VKHIVTAVLYFKPTGLGKVETTIKYREDTGTIEQRDTDKPMCIQFSTHVDEKDNVILIKDSIKDHKNKEIDNSIIDSFINLMLKEKHADKIQ
jgi:hypothetical protein